MGVRIAHVTLHVGLGTFRPVKVEDVLEHEMHSEYYVVEPEQAAIMNETKKKRRPHHCRRHNKHKNTGIRNG